jgi:hypothetical protein
MNHCSTPRKDKTLLFYEAFIAVMGPIKLPIPMGIGVHSLKVKQWIITATIHLHFYTYECVELHLY